MGQQQTLDALFEKALLEASAATTAAKAKKTTKKPGVHWVRGGKLILDKALVETMRSEFLTLMKSAATAKNYQEAWRVKLALRVWREKFDDFIFKELVEELPTLAKQKWEFQADDWAKRWEKDIRKGCWDLSIELSLPINNLESAPETAKRIWGGWDKIPEYEKRGFTEESFFGGYVRGRDEWIAKAKRGAIKAWKVLNDFVDWYEGGTGRKAVLDTGTNEVQNIEGFRTVLLKLGKSEWSDKWFSSVPPALRKFRARAQKVFPWILRAMLPMQLHFHCKLDEGGKYLWSERVILICVAGNAPDTLVHYIAHEMGHHVWQQYMSEDAQKFWRKAISKNWGPLDLRKVRDTWLRVMPGSKFYEFNRWMRDNDPLTYLKIDAVRFPPDGNRMVRGELDFETIDQLEKIIEKGEPVIAPENPITTYATKNEEEAFCEAFGYLVAFGPQAVVERVREWLQIVLPEIRIA